MPFTRPGARATGRPDDHDELGPEATADDVAAVETCDFPGLVTYNETQGFTLVHDVQRTHTRVYLMARRAEAVTDLAERLRAL
ncbi:hypothetical protein [Streptomyces cinnamoneus]|uniref:hypothetical protein n=1 Tax=Streptomyces cinnamoneus TaxID=53446 RepID=UPI001EFD4443|nr:hypothetical protein [Streptomyces cinnamoneus]